MYVTVNMQVVVIPIELYIQMYTLHTQHQKEYSVICIAPGTPCNGQFTRINKYMLRDRPALMVKLNPKPHFFRRFEWS